MKTKPRKRPSKQEPRNSGRRIEKGKTSVKRGIASVGAGLQPGSVRRLRDRFGISRKSFSRVVGFSERAIADWEASKPPSGACLQRIRELSRLQEALASVMKAEFVGTWLEAPNVAFGGLKPIEVIERGEVDRIWRMVYQLESGMPT